MIAFCFKFISDSVFIQLGVCIFLLYYKKFSYSFKKNNTPYTSKQPLMMAYDGSESAWNNFGKFIHQFQPETKTLIRKLERILNKLYRQNLTLLFNETCLNVWMHIFFFHHTTCESTCDTLASSAANQGDNTVTVAQGGTATPGATDFQPETKTLIRKLKRILNKLYRQNLSLRFNETCLNVWMYICIYVYIIFIKC